MTTDRLSVSVRLPPDLVARLDLAADERVLSRSKLVELLIAAGLDRLQPVERVTAPPAPVLLMPPEWGEWKPPPPVTCTEPEETP